MLELPKQNSEVDSMAEFFFRLKTYLFGYGKIDFEGILGVPFFMVNLTPARCEIATTKIDNKKVGEKVILHWRSLKKKNFAI